MTLRLPSAPFTLRLEHRPRLLPLLAGSILFTSCGGEAGPVAGALPELTPNSSDVARVFSPSATAGPDAQWVVNEITRIGGVDLEVEAPYIFEDIYDVRQLSDGRIAVVDLGASQVRLFSRDGSHSVSLGRLGDGPGEFRLVARVRECGDDGYYALDESKSVMKVFEYDGSFRNEFRLMGPNPAAPPYAWDCEDGEVLAMGWGDYDPTRPVGRYRTPVAITFAGLDGQVKRSLGWVLGPERYARANRGGTQPAPLGAATFVVVRAGVVYVAGAGGGLRVDAYTPEGGHLWRLEMAMETDVVDRARYVESQWPPGTDENRRPAFETKWRDWDLPERYPVVRDFLVDDGGRLWIERFPSVGARSVEWYVFDGSGRWLANVEVPGNVQIRDVRGEYAVGVVTSEVGVEVVGVYTLNALR